MNAFSFSATRETARERVLISLCFVVPYTRLSVFEGGRLVRINPAASSSHCNFTLKRNRFRNNAYPGISSFINELKNSVIHQKSAQIDIFCQINLSFHFGKLFGLLDYQHSIIKKNCNKWESLRVFRANHVSQFISPRKYPKIEVIIQKEAASIKFPLSFLIFH